MLRPSQRLCRQAFARPITRPVFRVGNTSRCSRPLIPQPSSPALLRPRYFTVSHSRLAVTSKIPNERGTSSSLPTSTSADSNTFPAINTIEKPFETSTLRPQRPQWRRRGLYYAALFLLLGTTVGTLFRLIIAPPALPPTGSDEDVYRQSKIQALGEALPLVQQLSADPSWTSWDAYAGIPTTPLPGHPRGVSAAQSRITSGPMSGSSGLAFQRIFHNAATGEVITIVYFGAGLAGWPGVVHGGALATVLDESLGRCALLKFPSRMGVTANLELQYRAPAMTNNFYIIRARPVVDEGDDVVGKDGIRKSDRKLWVHGTFETEKGKTCVDAKALFVVPKKYQLRPLVEGF